MVGCFLKLVYDTRISYSAFTINAGSWMEFADGHPNPGHIGLMQYYMTVMHLPDFDPRTVTCYSNPPFYYILCAAILKIIHQMMGWQIGTCLHCLLCLNAIYVLVGEICGIIMAVGFGIRDRKLVVTILILTFFPGFYNLTSTLDGTAFCYMCMMLALNAARSWYVSRRSKTLRTCGIWRGIGWGSIIYLAAMTSIDPTLYEAARIDGASKVSQIWHVTLPGLLPTIVLMLILKVGYILDTGFEQVLIFYNPAVYDVADIIQTYVYRIGLGQANFSLATALGLFNSVVAFILIVGANTASKKLLGRSIW